MLSRRDFGLSAATGAGAIAALSSGAARAEASAPTVSLNVLYPAHAGARFDLAYYRATHIPLAVRVMKPLGVRLIEGVATPTGPAPFAMIAIFGFPSLAVLQASTAAMAEVRADLTKFTDIKPTIMIGRGLAIPGAPTAAQTPRRAPPDQQDTLGCSGSPQSQCGEGTVPSG